MTIFLLILMAAGAILGRWLPENTVITRLADLLLRISIFALLFLLGIDIGGNDAVFSNLETVGLEAAAIAVFGILGCGPLAMLLQRWIRV